MAHYLTQEEIDQLLDMIDNGSMSEKEIPTNYIFVISIGDDHDNVKVIKTLFGSIKEFKSFLYILYSEKKELLQEIDKKYLFIDIFRNRYYPCVNGNHTIKLKISKLKQKDN